MSLSTHARSTKLPRFTAPGASLRWSVLIIAALSAGGALGCAFGELRPHDPLQREYSLEEIQKRYTDLVRFSNFGMAARFVVHEERKAFMHSMPDEDELRFLDYETDPFVLNEEMNQATIDVVYTAYSPWALTQIELYETQEWTRPDGIGNHWQVRSTFEGLEPYVKKRKERASRRSSSRAQPAAEGGPN